MKKSELIRKYLDDAKLQYSAAVQSGETKRAEALFSNISRLSEQLKSAINKESAQPTSPPTSLPTSAPAPTQPTQPAQPAMSSYQYISQNDLWDKLKYGQQIDARQIGLTPESGFGFSVSLEEIAKEAGIKDVFDYEPSTNTYVFNTSKARQSNQLKSFVYNLYKQAQDERSKAAFSGTYDESGYQTESDLWNKLSSGQEIDTEQFGLSARSKFGYSISLEELAREAGIRDVFTYNPSTNTYAFDLRKAGRSNELQSFVSNLYRQAQDERSKAAFSGDYSSKDKYAEFLRSGLSAEIVGGAAGSNVSAEQVAKMLGIADIYSKDPRTGNFVFDVDKALQNESFANWFDALNKEIESIENRYGRNIKSHEYRDIFNKTTRNLLPQAYSSLQNMLSSVENITGVNRQPQPNIALQQRLQQLKSDYASMVNNPRRQQIWQQIQDIQRQLNAPTTPQAPITTFGLGLQDLFQSSTSGAQPESAPSLSWAENRRNQMLARQRAVDEANKRKMGATTQPNMPPAWS